MSVTVAQVQSRWAGPTNGVATSLLTIFLRMAKATVRTDYGDTDLYEEAVKAYTAHLAEGSKTSSSTFAPARQQTASMSFANRSVSYAEVGNEPAPTSYAESQLRLTDPGRYYLTLSSGLGLPGLVCP